MSEMPRPECTCSPEIHRCPACKWWDHEGKYLSAEHMGIPHAAMAPDEPGPKTRYEPCPRTRRGQGGRHPLSREAFDADMQRWIIENGRLPTIADFDKGTTLRHSSRQVYRFYVSLPALWAHAKNQGWATPAMYEERMHVMRERRRKIMTLQSALGRYRRQPREELCPA